MEYFKRYSSLHSKFIENGGKSNQDNQKEIENKKLEELNKSLETVFDLNKSLNNLFDEFNSVFGKFRQFKKEIVQNEMILNNLLEIANMVKNKFPFGVLEYNNQNSNI